MCQVYTYTWLPRRSAAYTWLPRRSAAYTWLPRRCAAYTLLARRCAAYSLCALAASALIGCSSVPGETLTSFGQQRDVKSRVLSQSTTARCSSPKVVDTEVLEVHNNGKVAAERWAVDACGQRVYYRVSFPRTGQGSGFSIRPD